MFMSAPDQARLRDELDRELECDVRIELTLDDGESSRQAAALVEELTSLSPKLSHAVRRPDAGGRTVEDPLPSLVIEGAARGEVRFTGLPTGYEFPTFIDAIFATATGKTDLSPESLRRLGTFGEDRRVRVFTTPT